MNPEIILGACVLVAVASLAAGLALFSGMRQEMRLKRRISRLHGEVGPRPERPKQGIVTAVAALGGAVARSSLMPAKTRSELEASLASAGLRGQDGLALFVGSKLLLLVGAPLLAWVLLQGVNLPPNVGTIALLFAAVIGLLLPDHILRRNRKRYVERIERGIPDALDMLVICAQAGLGLDRSLERVATEIAHAHPGLADELAQTVEDMRVAVDTRIALEALGNRTGLDGLKRVTSTLGQTLQYGTPLTDALRVLSVEGRQLALTRFEERAARLPVMLTLPMILFIFPCVFIVVGAPAVMHIAKAFSH